MAEMRCLMRNFLIDTRSKIHWRNNRGSSKTWLMSLIVQGAASSRRALGGDVGERSTYKRLRPWCRICNTLRSSPFSSSEMAVCNNWQWINSRNGVILKFSKRFVLCGCLAWSPSIACDIIKSDGLTFIQLTSIHTMCSLSCAARLARKSLPCFTAPVSGRFKSLLRPVILYRELGNELCVVGMFD